jgi:hypothetical protein
MELNPRKLLVWLTSGAAVASAALLAIVGGSLPRSSEVEGLRRLQGPDAPLTDRGAMIGHRGSLGLAPSRAGSR